MKFVQRIKNVHIISLIIVLNACGGGGGDGGGDADPTGPSLSVAYAEKSLIFNWSEHVGATHYKFYENVDGSSGFVQVGSDIPAATRTYTLDVAVHLQQWSSARYMVEACDDTGCDASNVISANANVLQTIGQLFASNAEPVDEFSISVAISGDGNYIAVGAPKEDSNATGIGGNQINNIATESGAVYVFVRAGNTWSQQAYIKASNTDIDDSFGHAVAFNQDGTTLAVSAHLEDSVATGINGNQLDNSARDTGAVYVFTRNASTWSQEAYIKASYLENPLQDYTEITDHFGASIDLTDDGNMLVVGSPYEDSAGSGGNDVHSCYSPPSNCAINTGAVFVFSRTGGVWNQTAYIKGSNSESYDNFGTSVSINNNGDTLVVGAPYEDGAGTGVNSTPNNSANLAGAAYIFSNNGGIWTQQAYVKASNTDAVDFFGISVAVSGDGNTVAVSATREESSATGINGDQSDDSTVLAGAVYLFTRNSGVWTQNAYVKASNTDDNHHFGRELALNNTGSVLIVSATGDDSLSAGINGNQDDNSSSAVGAVYVFVKNANSWIQRSYVKSTDPIVNSVFGRSVDINTDGTILVVGEKTDISGSFPGDHGSVYIY